MMTEREAEPNAEQHAPQLLNQQRASFALEKVQAVASRPDARLFRSLLESFPALVRQTGLGQAVALQMSNQQRSDAATWVLDVVGEWLTQQGRPLADVPGGSLMDGLTQAPRHTYLEAQEEALIISGWLKTFAQALLPEGRQSP